MTEQFTIEKTKDQPSPVTVDSIKHNLTALGIKPGMVLLVHSSLSSLGWVCSAAVKRYHTCFSKGFNTHERHGSYSRDSNGQRVWQTFDDIETDDDLETIGKVFAEETGLGRVGKIGQADAKLVPQRELVDVAVRWMEKNRV
jgi:aminoglycoside N3'-acetyltransferase